MPQHFQVGAPPQVPSTPPAKPRKSKAGLLAAVAALAFLVGSGAGTLATLAATGQLSSAEPAAAEVKASPKSTQTILSVAHARCAPSDSAVRIGDGGKSLTIQTSGKKSAGISMTDLDCLLTQLAVTDAVRSEIESTRALDGRRSGDWSNLHATWGYHPDDGLNMVVTMP